MDIIANNMANMQTAGYRAERPLFQSYLQKITDQDGGRAHVAFADDYGMARNTDEGRMMTTSNPFDLAIKGNGYFVVETEAGERYTRNGHFATDSEGKLITQDGHAVLDANSQPIFFAANETDVKIARDGSISTSLGAKGQIQVVEFEKDSDLKRAGGSLFESDNRPDVAENVDLQQGVLEGSNVVPIEEMTLMISVMRAYSSASKLVKNAEDMTQRAIRQLGRPR